MRRCASRSSNKVGGGGVTAANYMVERKGDAHTLGVFTSVWMTNPLVQKAAATKVVDMAPIARLVIEPAVIVVRADSPYKTLRDVMDAALKESRQDQAGGRLAARARRHGAQLLMANTGGEMGVHLVPGGGRAARGAARRPCRFRAARAAGGRRADPRRQAARGGADRRQAAAWLRERADVQGGRLRYPERSAVARHHRPARHAGRRGRPTTRTCCTKMSRSPGWQKFLSGNQLDDAFLREGDDRVPRRVRGAAPQDPGSRRREDGALRPADPRSGGASSPSPSARRRTGWSSR